MVDDSTVSPEGVSPPWAEPEPRRSRGLTHSTLSGLFWMFLATGAQAGLQILVVAVLARLLTPADFGVVSAALILIGFTTIFSQLGVGPAVVQRPVLEARHLRTGFTLSLIFGALMTAIVWLVAPAAASFFRIDDLTRVIRALSLVFLLQGPSMIGESLLQRELKFRWLASIEVGAYALGFGGVGVAMAWMNMGVWSLVAAQLAQTTLKSVTILLVQPHAKRPLLERRALGDLLYFGGGFTAARVGNYAAGQIDQMMVGRWMGPEALGIFGQAHRLMTAPANFFGQVLDKVLFPAMVKIQDRSERLTLAYRRGVALIALVILPTSAVLFVTAPELIAVLLGPRWGAVVLPFQIFAVGMILRTSYKMSDSMARATGSVYRRAWRQAIYAGLVAAGAWGGLPWGVPGVAVGVLVAIAVNFLLMAQLSMSLTEVTWRMILEAHRPALLLTLVVGLETWGVAALMRARGSDHPLVLLLTVTLTVLATILALTILAPRRVLGEDGLWMVQTLFSYLPKRMNPFRFLKLDPVMRGPLP